MHVDDIDRFLARWRATLPPSFPPEHVHGFMQRHRAENDALVLKTLARRGAESGERPDIPADFLAYDDVTAAQRLLDAQTDAQVVQALMRKVDAQFAQGHNELSVFHNFAVEYIDARTEAILLRDVGWDVVPLLLERPALAIVCGGHVVAIRDWRGGLSIHPERRGTLNLEACSQGTTASQTTGADKRAWQAESLIMERRQLRTISRQHLGDTASPRPSAAARPPDPCTSLENTAMDIYTFARITLGVTEGGMALRPYERLRKGSWVPLYRPGCRRHRRDGCRIELSAG